MSFQKAGSPLVGRESEVAALIAALDQVVGGAPAAVVVRGEAGIGKSRLVAELRHAAEARDVPVLTGHCLDMQTALPFAPVVEALHDLLGVATPVELLDQLGSAVGELARLVPSLRGVADVPATGDRLALFTAVRDALAGRAPLLLLVEDLQWSDTSTRDLLSFVGRGRPVPVGLIITVRDTDLPEQVAGWLAEFSRGATVTQLWVEGLSRPQAAQLSAALTGRRPARSVDLLMARTGGNPFLIEEISSAVGPDAEEPMGLYDLLRRRLDGLPTDARRLVDAAAVGAMQRLDGALLASVTGLDPAHVPRLYRVLVGRGILRTVADTYSFRHGLLAEAVTAELVPEQRRELHGAWARALEQVDRGDGAMLAALAHHWEHAGESAAAARAALQAGVAAARELAHAEAAEEYARALRLCPDDDVLHGQRRSDVLRLAAWESARAGRFDDAVEHVREALRLVDDRIDPRGAGLLHDLLGHFHMAAGREDEFLAAKRRALELMPVDPPTADAAYLLARTAHGYFVTDRVSAARSLADQAVAMAQRLDEATPLARALGERAAVLAALGELDDARADLEAAADALDQAVADAQGEDGLSGEERELMLPAIRLLLLLAGAQYGELLQQATQLVEAASRRQVRGETEFARQMVTVAALRRGEWDRARAVLQEMEEHDYGGDHMRRHRACLHLELAVATGEVEATRTRLHELEATAPSDLLQRHDIARLHAEFACWQHRPQEALTVCADALRATVHPGAEPLAAGVLATALRAHAEVPVGVAVDVDVPDAEGIFARLEDVTAGRGPEPMAYRATGRAELSRLRGTDPDAWNDAAVHWAKLGVPYRLAYCEYRQAEALLHTAGDHAAAAELLRRAADTSRRLGATPLHDEVAALARRARVALDTPTSSPAPAAPPPDRPTLGLTPREQDVLDLLADGATNVQIAGDLFVSEKTVEGHVSNILRKLGAANRVEAASRYHRSRTSIGPGQ